MVMITSGIASPTLNWCRYANFKVLSLFISLETDCFQSVNCKYNCIAGLNRQVAQGRIQTEI